MMLGHAMPSSSKCKPRSQRAASATNSRPARVATSRPTMTPAGRSTGKWVKDHARQGGKWVLRATTLPAEVVALVDRG